MKILLTGVNGQIGYELQRGLQGLGEVVALDRGQLDLSDLARVREAVRTVKPSLIINPAAYTAVDQAESEPGLAMRINGEAPAAMAEEARALGAAMIHYSTDYVFDGSAAGPYTEDMPTCPVNAYGASKLEGEQAVRNAGIPHLVLRTSWIYGMRGKNFLLTMLRLAAERPELRVVADQYGAPTWCRTVADATVHVVAQSLAQSDPRGWLAERGGLYHLTAQGKTSWHGFAQAILAHPGVAARPPVLAIASSAYPTPARRPTNSVLSCRRWIETFSHPLPRWEEGLKLCQN